MGSRGRLGNARESRVRAASCQRASPGGDKPRGPPSAAPRAVQHGAARRRPAPPGTPCHPPSGMPPRIASSYFLSMAAVMSAGGGEPQAGGCWARWAGRPGNGEAREVQAGWGAGCHRGIGAQAACGSARAPEAMKPGATELQVMLRPAHSRATVLVRAMTPGRRGQQAAGRRAGWVGGAQGVCAGGRDGIQRAIRHRTQALAAGLAAEPAPPGASPSHSQDRRRRPLPRTAPPLAAA